MSGVVFNNRLLFLIFFILVVFQSTLSLAKGHGVVQFSSVEQKLDLSSYIEILVDEDHVVTIDDVEQYDFQSVAEIGNSFGFSKARYWVRFTLEVDVDADVSDALLLQLGHPSIDDLTFFAPNKDGGFDQTVTGESLDHATREINHRTYLFRLPEQAGEVQTYYLRLQTEGSMQIPLTLWTASAFIESVNHSNILFGAYYGIIFLLILAAFTSFIKVHDKLFIWYGLYLFSYLLLQFSLNGFSYQYLWPELPQWSSRFTAASAGFVGVCALAFSGVFLQIWGGKHCHLKRGYLLLIFILSVGIMMSLFGDYVWGVKMSTGAGVMVPPVIFIAALTSMISGYKPARYFFAAWTIFLAGVFTQGLLYFGHVSHNFFTLNAMQIGSMIEVLLLGYALTMKIDLLRNEKNTAQIKAHKYLNQLNEELESLVDERTQDLQVINEKLSELVCMDGMSKLLNHNASIEYLKRMELLAKRYGNDLAVIMLDIDFFKGINDTFGHPAGDKVIIAVANILKDSIRDSDGGGRYGGEEFILVLPETSSNNAEELAERIRKTIMKISIADIDNKQVTASFGISVFDPLSPNADLIRQADEALYKAKQSGRNNVMLFES